MLNYLEALENHGGRKIYKIGGRVSILWYIAVHEINKNTFGGRKKRDNILHLSFQEQNTEIDDE